MSQLRVMTAYLFTPLPHHELPHITTLRSFLTSFNYTCLVFLSLRGTWAKYLIVYQTKRSRHMVQMVSSYPEFSLDGQEP